MRAEGYWGNKDIEHPAHILRIYALARVLEIRGVDKEVLDFIKDAANNDFKERFSLADTSKNDFSVRIHNIPSDLKVSVKSAEIIGERIANMKFGSLGGKSFSEIILPWDDEDRTRVFAITQRHSLRDIPHIEGMSLAKHILAASVKEATDPERSQPEILGVFSKMKKLLSEEANRFYPVLYSPPESSAALAAK